MKILIHGAVKDDADTIILDCTINDGHGDSRAEYVLTSTDEHGLGPLIRAVFEEVLAQGKIRLLEKQ